MVLIEKGLGVLGKTPMQRTYNWHVFLPDIWGTLIGGAVVGNYCQSIKFGQYNFSDIVKLSAGAKKKHYASQLDIDSFTMSFVTPIPDTVMMYFVAWKNLIVDNQGFYSPSSVYKKTVRIVLLDRTGIPVNMISLKEAFPKNFPSYDLSYPSSDVHRYDITLSFDKILMGLNSLADLGPFGAIVSGVIYSMGGSVIDYAKRLGLSTGSIGSIVLKKFLEKKV